MYIVRWLKGHPLIAVWVLGIIAILLSWSGGTFSKKTIEKGHITESTLTESHQGSKHGDVSGKSVSEVLEKKKSETISHAIAVDDSVSKPLKAADNKTNHVESTTENKDLSLDKTEFIPKTKRDVSSANQEEKIQPEESLAKVESVEASTEETILTSLPVEEVKGAIADIKISNREDMLLMAREAFWNNGLDEAGEIYIQLIKLEPDVLDHKGELGNVYWRQGYPKKAAELYSEIAIPMIQGGKMESVANMIGFIGLFYPDRAAQINDHLQAEVGKKK